MRKNNNYDNYQDYINHQKEKTTDPKRRKKWLGSEWDLKKNGFIKIFNRYQKEGIIEKGQKALCIGARTGQEVVALNELGLDAIGIDLVECIPHVLSGDMHNLSFKDNTFDFIYTNVFDHSLYPDKMIEEIERVLKVDGVSSIQLQIDTVLDKYTETEIDNISLDILPLFKKSICIKNIAIRRNFANMNFELIMKKDKKLVDIYENITSLYHLYIQGKSGDVSDENLDIWTDIMLPQKVKEAVSNNIPIEDREKLYRKLSCRATYLANIAKYFNCTNIAEVGTAGGWQFYTFANILSSIDNGHVWSCDVMDVRSSTYKDKYKDNTTFILGSDKVSSDMAIDIKSRGSKIDLFYIDGSRERGHVLRDVLNLKSVQAEDSIWVFDDFDIRFGSYYDILHILKMSKRYQIYKVGQTASGHSNHQVIIYGKL